MKKHFKKILATLLIVLVVAFGFVGNYFYNFGLNPKVDKSGIVNQDSDGSKEDKTAINKWFDETKQVTEMESVTKNKLVGYKFVNPDAKKWIFVVHGYTSDAKKMANYIKKFYDMGYSVFAPDLIAHGNSEGDFISMGGYDSDDLVNWVKKISAENNNADTALFGISMGAATVMNAVGKNLPSNVKAIIADSSYTSVWDIFKSELKARFNLPPFPLMQMFRVIAKIQAKYDIKEASVINQVKKSKLPILLIHGDADDFVPVTMESQIYESLPGEKDQLIVHGAGHTQSRYREPEAYYKKVFEFVDKYEK